MPVTEYAQTYSKLEPSLGFLGSSSPSSIRPTDSPKTTFLSPRQPDFATKASEYPMPLSGNPFNQLGPFSLHDLPLLGDSPDYTDMTGSGGSGFSGFSTPVSQSPQTPDTTPVKYPLPSMVKRSGGGDRASSQTVMLGPPTSTLQVDGHTYYTSDLQSPLTKVRFSLDVGDRQDSTRLAKAPHTMSPPVDPSIRSGVSTLKHKGFVGELRKLSDQSSPESQECDDQIWNAKQASIRMDEATTRHKDPYLHQRFSESVAPETIRSEAVSDVVTDRAMIRRLSADSATVVKATVVYQRPQMTQRLRHVSKTDSLRSGVWQQPSHEASHSEPPFEVLSRPSTHRNSLSIDSTTSFNSTTTRTLRRKRDTAQLRLSTTPGELAEYSEDGSKTSTRIPTTSGSSQDKYSSIPPELRSLDSPRAMPGSFPLSVESASSTSMERSGLSGTPEVFHDAASHVSYQPSFETLHSRILDIRAARADQPVRPSLESQVADGRRVSFNPSLAQSDITGPYRFSPLSARSDATLTYEVKEAAAINFFPHNNESLVVVHHAGSCDLSSQHTAATTPTQQTIDPSATPTMTDLAQADDSPLQNPRVAPEPPVVAVIPPTPARELDAQDDAVAVRRRTGSVVTRSTSLMQRARRYSDTFMQPFTGNSRRRPNGRSMPRPRSARHAPNVAEQEAGNLHPFWRPRGFWNDLSDSEDEYFDDDEDHTYPHTEQRDTLSWRRGNSIRGFLIGNSLGLERGPTNKRRPVIVLPSVKPKTTSDIPDSEPTTVRDSVRRSAKLTKPRRSSEATPSNVTKFVHSWREKINQHKMKKDDEEVAGREERREQLRAIITQMPNNDPEINWAQTSVPGQSGIP